MKITVNGEVREFERALTIEELLLRLGYGERRVAVEVNRQIVPRSAHATRSVAAGDAIEIVYALGGG
jgi:sulfur carrier protein